MPGFHSNEIRPGFTLALLVIIGSCPLMVGVLEAFGANKSANLTTPSGFMYSGFFRAMKFIV